MTRPYNELVGLQATFSRVIPRYNLSMLYQWKDTDETRAPFTHRGHDMRRHLPVATLVRNLADVYAPAVLSIWRLLTDANYSIYLQFEVGARPDEVHLPGEWEHWAQL